MLSTTTRYARCCTQRTVTNKLAQQRLVNCFLCVPPMPTRCAHARLRRVSTLLCQPCTMLKYNRPPRRAPHDQLWIAPPLGLGGRASHSPGSFCTFSGRAFERQSMRSRTAGKDLNSRQCDSSTSRAVHDGFNFISNFKNARNSTSCYTTRKTIGYKLRRG